jgi:hypothetical protein
MDSIVSKPTLLKAALMKAGLAACALLFAGATFADATVTLTASPQTATLSDGQSVPMWGYTCGDAQSPAVASVGATCTAMNGTAQSATTWQPPLIRIPSGTTLTITLVNNLSFAPSGNTVPTSLVIVGQVGGGLGDQRTTSASPPHAPYGTTWPGTAGGTDTSGAAIIIDNPGSGYIAANPPAVTFTGGDGVAATGVAVVSASGQVTAIQITSPGAGYTNVPPTITIAPPPASGVTALAHLPAANIPDLNSAGTATFTPPAQADRVRSMATEVVVGTPQALSWNALRPGTYLIHSGTQPSIQHPMGLYAVLVVADPAATAAAPNAWGTAFDADIALLLSEIDPDQNRAVSQAVNTVGFSDTLVWNGQSGQCGDPAAPVGVRNTCYPPAVNYSPLYYLVNGVSFDRTQSLTTGPSAIALGTAVSSGNVLLRFVNAGLRLHVPQVVNNTMTLLAEDGNPAPGAVPGSTQTQIARKQASVALQAGKTFDVAIQPKQTTAGTYDAATYAIYDRQLSLSTANQRDGGMQALLVVGTGGSSAPGSSTLTALDRGYYCISGSTLAITDPSKGLLGGATGASGVATTASSASGLPAGSTLTVNPNGTFTYAPPSSGACGGSFTYLVNNTLTKTATITECDSTTPSCPALAAAPTAGAITFISSVKSRFASTPPGVLAGVTANTGGLTLTAQFAGAAPSNVQLNADGSFVATPNGGACTGVSPTPPANSTCTTFNYQAKNAQGTLSNTAAATVVFLPGSGMTVSVVDGPTGKPITDYRWIIEEDRTFWIDPKCQINTTASRTDSNGRPCAPLPVESLGYSFHTASMPVVAQGCQGTASCEAGQTSLGANVICDVGNGACRPGAQKTPVSPSDVYLDPTKRYFISILPGDGINTTIGGSGGPAGGVAALSQTGKTVTLTNPTGFFGVVKGDKITIDSSSVAASNNVCTVTAVTQTATTTTLTCTVATAVTGTQTSLSANYANNRKFDIAKDCGAYNYNGSSTTQTYPDTWWPGGNPAAGAGGPVCGHAMGGAQIPSVALNTDRTTQNVKISLQQTPLPTAQISVFVFQDDSPLNGENDAGGGVDIIAPNEPGLGGFEIKLFDQAGGLGDATGQITYDMFNQPVTNSLAGKIDPITGLNACPITARSDGIVGMIPTCPMFESDGVTPSPLAGQAVINNLYPGLYEIQAYPAADRIGRGEEWLQTNTLDGGKPHEAFIKPNEPGYFQEFGPGGFHVAIGFANPAIINARKAGYCASSQNTSACNNTLTVNVTNTHMSRTPDQRTYSSETYDHYSFTQCYVAISQADAQAFALEKCVLSQDPTSGKTYATATFTNMPAGVFQISVFDQWNDIMLDGLVGTVSIPATKNAITFPVTQWRTNLYTRTFLDTDGSGVSTDDKPGLALVNTNIRYRDGSFGFFNNTDLNGYAAFNEVFPFMNWLVVETSSTRHKSTGVHTVYDAGGPVDCSNQATALGIPCSTVAANLANTQERTGTGLPADLRVPGARYCDGADCGSTGSTETFTGGSTGVIFPPQAFGNTQGWQSMLGQNSFIEFAVKPFVKGENGGISGQVIYASTRPFDDPQLLLQLQWEPGIPRVGVNLYQKTVDDSGNEKLTLVDWTTSASWDDWAQGFRSQLQTTGQATVGTQGASVCTATSPCTCTTTNACSVPVKAADGASYVPNMNCPGQDNTSPFFQTLKNSKQWLDSNNPKLPLAYNSRFKCYDGWSQLNQIQPAPYDGYYRFPSITAIDSTTGKQGSTNCTICTPNTAAAQTDWDYGAPTLPPGKYVVEVIIPTGYELVKEEDKNILMGDVYIAPITTQFAGFGNVFIMPDQAAMNATYNPQNPGGLNRTTNIGATPRHEGDTGSIEQFWPCVGAERIVPDLNSLFPGAGQAAPFAGAKRRLCDRKEVTLDDQNSALTKFYLFSSTHIAGHFTGTITNDFASEFDPFSPQFGEKFGPPNLPVGLRDFNGNEVARVYSDQWGIYNGLYFSTWGVNPPNPTGYAPQMSIACMNDPGPITLNGVSMTDPSYNPAYSNFCYETPFMPGFTAYMDTPVIPTQSFADGYNLPDSEYPDGTPAIGSVTSADFAGPWVSATGHSLTINCLNSTNTADPCSKVVQNPNFTGPNATTAPYNQKTITRHYGFGSGGTVTIAGTPATVTSWSNTQIVVTVPTINAGLSGGVGSTCYNGSSATPPAGQTPRPRGLTTAQASAYRCGELVITRSDNGKKSIDAITVTVAGSSPWLVTPTLVTAPAGTNKSVNDYGAQLGRMGPSPIQVAIDSASPGDLIIVGAGTYRENLIMWKPVRLQGVGAGSVTINADAHPAGKMDQWRRQVTCAFGLNVDGAPNLGNTSYDSSGQYSCPAAMHQRVDRIPFEAIIGWDASGNGNLAQVLQEPTLMGAYEGAGITVLGRGVRIPAGSTDFWGQQATGGAGAFTDGSVYLTSGNADCTASTTSVNGRDYGTSNFLCNPSRIDGLSVINSSQGGGGVFIHGWAHYLDVGNTRISGNHGTLAGAINLGNGETPDAFLNDGVECNVTPAVTPCPPTSWNGFTPLPNGAIPFQFNTFVRIHHNMLYNNASIGDALFSGTPAGAGAVTVSAGADGYQLDHNWMAGNLSTGDGGGVQHLGLSFQGKITNNYILYNQSTNPTLPTNGGGLVIEGANLDRTLAGNECGSTNDQDCPPGLGEGTGFGMVIDGNLIVGNSAESGSGGGIRLQQVNGSELVAFPILNAQWYDATLTNNIIANNVAGWDGAGVSIQDALRVTIINNTVASNDTTASAGVLFKTLGAINAASPPPGCTPQTDPSLPQDPSCTKADAPHGPQPAGLVVMAHTPNLQTAIAALPVVSCPGVTLTGNQFGYTGVLGLNGDCRALSKPRMVNDLFWQNRSFAVNIVGAGTGNQSQQNLVALTPSVQQTQTGQCVTPSPLPSTFYWDIGLRTDDITAGLITTGNKLALTNSVYTADTQGVVASNTNNTVGGTMPVVAQFCNGARMPPEHCTDAGVDYGSASCQGFNAPAGASETTGVTQLFVFNGIQPTATVDEGHNWLNLSYGPLTLTRPNISVPTAGEQMIAGGTLGTTEGAYSIPAGSTAVNRGTTAGVPAQVGTDIFGNTRTGRNDAGAVQLVLGSNATVRPTSINFGTVILGQTSAAQTLTLTAGTTAMTGVTITVSGPGYARAAGGTCPATPFGLAASTIATPSSCTFNVTFAPTTGGQASGSVAIASNVTVVGSPVALTGAGVAIDVLLTPTALTFNNFVNVASTQLVTVTNTSSPARNVTGIAIAFSGPGFLRSTTTAGTCPTTATFALNVGGSCTIGVQFTPNSVGTVVGSLLATADAGFTISGPVALTGIGYQPSVAPSTLDFGNITVGKASAPQTLTLSNPLNAPTFNITSVSETGPFSRPAGTAGGTCGTTLAGGATCTINIVYTAGTGSAQQTGTATINGNAAVAGSPVTLTGTPVAVPSKPALSVLDNFNRANATNLGGNWQQGVVATLAAIAVNGNNAFDLLTANATAYWNVALTGSGNSQAAGATLVNVSAANAGAVILRASGAFSGGNYANAIRVRYTGTAVVVETTTNGTTYTVAATLAGTFAAGNNLTALVDNNGNVHVWRTVGATVTYLGSAQLGAAWGTGGQIGIGLGVGGRIDDFQGGITAP